MIFPSIDLMNGKVVQLVQGKEENKKLEIDDVFGIAEKYSKLGELHIIDLDGALGKGGNLKIIKELCKRYNARIGGGIRTEKKAHEFIEAGAKKIIIGSAAFEDGKVNKTFLRALRQDIPKEKIIIAIDSKEGKIVTKGWTMATGIPTTELIKELEHYCSEFLYTYVDKEGMMEGTDLDMLKKLAKLTKNEITAAGGISSINEIKKLEKIGVNSVLGMALYTGKIKYEDLLMLVGK